MLRPLYGTGPRALFYSHDTVGLGHIRRTLRICEHLDCSFPSLSMLLVTGSPVAHGFRAPAGQASSNGATIGTRRVICGSLSRSPGSCAPSSCSIQSRRIAPTFSSWTTFPWA
jgi:hypothetical protein